MTIGLKHRTLSAAIADHLRQEILSGVHPSGEQLRQDALAAAYNVSRIPVREALFQLEAEGLVRIEPHKGAVVTSVSLDEFNDVFDLRVLLEERLFRQSIPALTDPDFARLDVLQAAFAAAIKLGDVRQWGTLNAELHAVLYSGARLPRTTSTVAALLQTSDRFTRMQLSTPAAMKRAEREHALLISLARKRAASEACSLLVQHIETVRSDLLKLMPQRKPVAKAGRIKPARGGVNV